MNLKTYNSVDEAVTAMWDFLHTAELVMQKPDRDDVPLIDFLVSIKNAARAHSYIVNNDPDFDQIDISDEDFLSLRGKTRTLAFVTLVQKIGTEFIEASRDAIKEAQKEQEGGE